MFTKGRYDPEHKFHLFTLYWALTHNFWRKFHHKGSQLQILLAKKITKEIALEKNKIGIPNFKIFNRFFDELTPRVLKPSVFHKYGATTERDYSHENTIFSGKPQCLIIVHDEMLP